MNDADRTSDADRIEESVRHALRLVGPGERGIERVWSEETTEKPAA